MQVKLKISAVFLALLLCIMPLTVITANANSFKVHLPSFGLYCENQNADVRAKIKYVIDENGKAVEYSEYTISGTNELNFKIPFISRANALPQINLTVNQKAVTGEICYGKSIGLYNENYDLDNFYHSRIEDVTGTLYSLTTQNKSITVDLETYDNQNFIYLLPFSRLTQPNNNSYSFTLENAQPEVTYEIYALNGDFKRFESNADAAKEELTFKEYIDRNYNKLNEDYYADENITVEFFYSIANGIIESKTNCEFVDFFLESISKQRITAYKVDLQTDTEICTVAYSMPVEVQINNAFKPAIYMVEHSAARNYNVDYTIELNSELPYVIESSAVIKKQSGYVYTAQNVTEDFYFVFSSSKKPESIYANSNYKILKIVLLCFIGVAVCVLIVLITLLILCCIKDKKR